MTPPLATLSSWLTVITLIVVGAAFIAFLVWHERRRGRALRRQHFQTHPQMTDADFVLLVKVTPDQAPFACLVRKAIAATMRVPPSTLHPADELAYVAGFGFEGIDHVEFLMRIERALRTNVPDAVWKEFLKSKTLTVTTLIQFLGDRGYLAPPRPAAVRNRKTLPPPQK